MPQSVRFHHQGATLRAEPLTEALGPLRLVWLHGWGQSRENLRPLAESLLPLGESWLLDLPGHGEAPNPPHTFGPADYAELTAAWLATQPPCPTIILGHSFGFRVAIYLGVRRTPGVAGLVSIAGAGVPKDISSRQAARRGTIRLAVKMARLIKPFLGEAPLNRLRQRFGSPDYVNASAAMRSTFLAVVNDDVSPLCPEVSLPTLLIYGDADTETPPTMGRRFQSLLPQAELHVLPHQTHHSLLAGGRHVTAPLIKTFLKGLLK